MRYQGASFSQAKLRWSSATMTVRIIVVNLILFLLYHIGGLICFFSGSSSELILQWVELPSNLAVLATRPWTVLTYMVSHYNFFHILFNLLWLYWLGTLFERTYGPRRTLLIYIWGGLAGAAAYLLVMNLLGANAWMLGASASVMAIVMATTVMMPNYTFLLLLFGPVKLKWIAVVTAVLFLFGLEGTNLGGNVAHFGGIIMGLAYGFFWLKRPQRYRSSSRSGSSRWNIKFPKFKSSKKSSSNSSGSSYSSGSYSSSSSRNQQGSYSSNNYSSSSNSSYSSNSSNSSSRTQGQGQGQSLSQQDQEELDKILDKIKKTGYAGLTAEEKRRLFDVSSRIK